MKYFVTAIDTDSGKTFVSAILCEALKADYWKPVQAGNPKDSDVVKSLVSNTTTKIHPETYLLHTPASPHASAKIDGVEIKLDKFIIPTTSNDLIIEGAGGCMVPLNETEFIVDLITSLNSEVILVADLYLGSINHSLLTVEALKNRGISIKGIIFNGKANLESERIILRHAKVPCLLKVQKEEIINRDTVIKYATMLKENWK